MTMPSLIVEIGFTAALTGTALHIGDSERGIIGTATIAATDLFTDVSAYVTSVTTRRGATRTDGPYLRYEAGTCTINFRNDDRRFDPSNLAGPYVSAGVTQVEPLRAVRIRANYGGRTYPLWRGFTDEWSVSYEAETSTATVTCFDAFGIFAAHNRLAQAAVGAGEDTGARITRILNSINWPASDRVIETGDEEVQSTTLADNVLTEMQLTADTELGDFYVDAQGRVAFRGRNASYFDERSRRSLVAFGDQPVDGVDTTINLVSNPSAETSLSADWAGGGFANPPTLTRDSTRAMFGSWAVLATWATAISADLPLIQYAATGLTAGRTYTFSVYAYVPTGSPSVACVISGTGPWGTNTGGLVDQWVRLTLTATVTSSSVNFQLWPENSTTTAGQQVWLDGLQIEEGAEATAYCDGTQTNCEWDGVAHTSTSRRLPELPYADAALAYDALSITNTVLAARVGGTEQTAEDSSSVSAYLTRSHSRSDLLMQSDAQALIWAEQIVYRTANPELRFAAVELKGSRDSRLYAQAFGREIGDRVRVFRRPPGGGDPIEREAWVRGVEHTLPVSQDWRTVLTLQQAIDVADIIDAFTATESNGWGTANGGEAWTVSGTASEYAKTGGVGTHTHPSALVLHSSTITGAGSPHATITVDVTVPVVPSGGAVTVWVTARGADASNYYAAQVTIGTTGTTTLNLYRRVAGVLSAALATASVGTHVAGQTWRIRFDALGTLLRAQTWRPASESQPASWQVSVYDTTFRTGEQLGLLSRRESGNTNTNLVFSFDNYFGAGRATWA